MANNKSIQILRGGPNYDPSTSTEILLDGQPFYSKKTKKLYIGDGKSELKQLPGIDIDLNIENGEGSGSIEQIGYTEEGLYKDFRHYAAAYGIVAASGGEVNPETIEATMTAYTYEQLLGMIAQANFGGDTATAQAYIDSMITSELEGFDITKANKVEGTAATALGVGNTVYSPGAIAVGYDNEIGLKGYPQNALFSAAIGENNSVQNKASIAIGKDLIVKGSCSAAIGKATTYSPADYEVEDGKANVFEYFENLQELKPTISSFIGEEVSNLIPTGTINDDISLELNKLYGETSILVGKSNAFASNSITVGYANSAYGLNSATFGNQNINVQLNSVVGGSLNIAGYDGVNKQLNLGSALFGRKNKAINNYTFAAGLGNTVEGEYGTAVGLENNVKATLASSAGGYNEIKKAAPFSFVGGEKNKAINPNQTVFGKLNKGIDNTLLEIGNGWEEINNITWKEAICTFNADKTINTIDFRGYDPTINYTLYIKSIKKNGVDLIDFKNQIIHDFIEFPENSPRASAKIVKDNNGVEVLALSNVWFSVNRFWSFKIKTADNIFKANDIIRVEYYLYSGDKSANGEVAFNKTYLSGISQSIYGEQIKPDIDFIRSNAFEVLKDGTATADKFQSKESVWDGESVKFSDNTLGTQKGDIVPGAIASGFESAAFGGLRYNYYTSPETHAENLTIDPSSTENWGRTPTSAEGNQSFAAGGSSHAYGDWAVAMGKDAKAYQGASLSIGGSTKAGMTFEEWKALHNPNNDPNFNEDTEVEFVMGTELGTSEAYKFSYKSYYSFAVALGESAKAYQRSSVAIGKDAKAYAWNAIAIGKNAIAGVSGFANEGDSAIALGLNAKATKSGAMALGEGTASGVRSLVLQSGNAIGTGSVAIKGTANGSGSIAIGPSTANSGNSFAIGHEGTTADKWNSFAIGRNAKSTADTSFSYGFKVTSSATAALAINEGTQALHTHSLAAGFYTKTGAKYQAVFGKHNIGKSDTLFEIGNGTSDTARSNIFEIQINGTVNTSKGTLATQDWVKENGGFTPVSYRPVETTYGNSFTFNLGEEEIANNGVYLIEISTVGPDQDCIGASLTFTGENATTWVASPCIHYYMSSDGKKEIYPNTYIEAYCMGPYQIYVCIDALDNSKTVTINPANVKLTRIA